MAATLSTLSVDGLQHLLGGLGLEGPIPPFPEADISSRAKDIYHSYLADVLLKLVDCDAHVAYEAIQSSTEISNGDLVIVLPKLRLPGVNPADTLSLGLDLTRRFPQSPLFSLPIADGVNLRVFLSARTLSRILLPYIRDRGDTFGLDKPDGLKDPASPESGKKKVIVEFSSPNIGKEFTGSHLRSTIVGASAAAMYEARGWEVVRMNFLGDWGKHIGLLATGWTRFGSDELLEADPLRHLLDVYNQINELFKPEQEKYKALQKAGEDVSVVENQGIWAERDAFFKRLEDGEQEAVDLYKKFRHVSTEVYKKLYASMNVQFDEYSGESQVKAETIAEVESILRQKGVYEELDGSWQINFDLCAADARPDEASRRLGTVITRFRNGTTSYLLRDIAAALERDRQYSFDKMVYVVTAEQHFHFLQIFKALEIMGFSELNSRIERLDFSKVQGLAAHGLLLSDIIKKCEVAAETAIEGLPADFSVFDLEDPQTALRLGVAGLLAQDLGLKRGHVVQFDVNRMASLDLDNGISLQRWYAKLDGKLRGHPGGTEQIDLQTLDYTSIEDEDCGDLLRLLAQFPEITKTAFGLKEPSMILTYVYRVVDQLNRVMWADDAVDTPARLVLFESVRQVLDNAMKTIGIPAIVKY